MMEVRRERKIKNMNNTIRQIFKETSNFINKEIKISGWVKTLRDSKVFGFIELNDGTFFKNLQVVF
jgi:asparaginyl-tRNA synthetase